MKCPICSVAEGLPTSPSTALTEGMLIGLFTQGMVVGMLTAVASTNKTILCASHDAWARDSGALLVDPIAEELGLAKRGQG